MVAVADDRPVGWDAADATDEEIEALTAGARRVPDEPAPSADRPRPLTAEERALFRSIGDIFDGPADTNVWVSPWFAGYGLLSLLIAKTKGGKTQLVFGLVRAMLEGEDFLGAPVECDVVIYLTEQGNKTLRDQLARAGMGKELESTSRIRFLRLMTVGHLSWEERVSLVDRIVRTEYVGLRVLVVVDTIGKWAGLKPREENDAGAMGQTMLPLQRLAQDHDLAVLVLQHARRRDMGDDEDDLDPSDAGRGSTAVPGDADIVMLLSKPSHRQAEERRVRILRAEGRMGDIPERRAIEWLEDGTFVVLAEGEEIESIRLTRAILVALAAGPLTEDELAKATKASSRSTLRRAIDALTSPTGDMLVTQLEEKRDKKFLYALTKAMSPDGRREADGGVRSPTSPEPSRPYPAPLVSSTDTTSHDGQMSVDEQLTIGISLETSLHPLVIPTGSSDQRLPVWPSGSNGRSSAAPVTEVAAFLHPDPFGIAWSSPCAGSAHKPYPLPKSHHGYSPEAVMYGCDLCPAHGRQGVADTTTEEARP
jgi:hypothetical protein